MNPQKIMHTFDYEVFLKRSGTVNQCMIEPTDKLIEIFSSMGGRATFFVDTVFIDSIRRVSPKDYILVSDQLMKLADNGHRIELHLHPSWRDAVYDKASGEWISRDFRHYSLFSLPETEVNKLFQKGIELLQAILRPVDKNYVPIAFRAGGWSLGTDNLAAKAMRNSGIVIDSSVAPGMFREPNPVQYFDFRKAPHELPHWRFREHPAKPDDSGNLIEIPISTMRLIPARALARKIRKKIYRGRYSKLLKVIGDGQGMALSDILSSSQLKRNRLRNSLFPKYIMHTLQDMMPGELDNFFNTRKVIVSISHPKNLSEASYRELSRTAEKGLSSITLLEYFQSL